jgi:hypothetical protein
MSDVPNAGLDAAQNAIVSDATTYYLGLNTGDPGQTGAHEGGDGRQAITFAASSGGSQASDDAQNWSSAVGGYTYTNFSVWSASSGGTYVRGGALTTSITPGAGQPIQFISGATVFTAS